MSCPHVKPRQKVWLSSCDLPIRVVSRKLATGYVGPFDIVKVISPSAVCLKLPASCPVHITIQISQLKLVSSSDLSADGFKRHIQVGIVLNYIF